MADVENNVNPVDAESTAKEPVVPASIPERDNTSAETPSGEFRAFFVGADSDTKAPAFVDTVYQQIDAVIGGNDPNQFLCLTIPGQALSAEDFTYDYKAAETNGDSGDGGRDPTRYTGEADFSGHRKSGGGDGQVYWPSAGCAGDGSCGGRGGAQG